MPAVHTRIYDWLARTEGTRNRVLMVFRGCGKSTILGVRNAHKYRRNPEHQLLVQGADDDLADDISRDTLAILRGNELTRSVELVEPAGVRHWFTRKGMDGNARTPQYRGRGILSRVTGNRADEIINDDTEMSKNVENPEARAKLRKRLSEQGFILKPGGSVLWVGTPHTHDSIYEQKIAAGAQALIIPLFAHQTRNDDPEPRSQFRFAGEPDADGVWVFVGVGKFARLLVEGRDYVVRGNVVHTKEPVSGLVDVCIGNAWPERFDRKEMEMRRKDCETVNYWDQQYQLQAKPLVDSRLNPERMMVYDVEPHFDKANRQTRLWLGKARIVGATLRWDPSSGKVNSDVSALALMFMDQQGRRYWHRALSLEGDVVKFAADGKTITGGQVMQIADIIEKYKLRRLTIETNGIGKFSPAIVLACLKQRGLVCGVTEINATTSKNKRILEAFEPLLLSGMLWAHTSVVDGPVFEQMRDWDPAVADQPDDYLDAGAGAATDQPERVGDMLRNRNPDADDDWRPSAGVFEAELSV